MERTKQRNRIKKIVDILMSILLLCLMAYQVTGETLHEWIGIGMTAVLILHHILNYRWYKSLFKGKYNAYRIVTVIVNTLLLAAIALTAVCGMAMSGHAVPFLYGILPVFFARRFHLAMSFWSFILMGLHLGMHVPAMTSGWRISEKSKTACAVSFSAIAGIGLMLFIKNGIPDYIFFRTPFAFFDYAKPGVLVFIENLTILIFFALLGTTTADAMQKAKRKDKKKKEIISAVLPALAAILIGAFLLYCTGNRDTDEPSRNTPAIGNTTEQSSDEEQIPQGSTRTAEPPALTDIDDGFVLISGGSFLMGSPDTENWRIDDETQHAVTVSSFYIDPHETTQEEYERLMGENPSEFRGNNLPVENITWLEAVRFANARSTDNALTPVYSITEEGVTWDRSANGYRLPTEAEWEYACRAGTQTPFNYGHTLGADNANFYGHYPYEIEENYFDNSSLEAKPGVYRQKTVDIGSFYQNAWGLYDMHGNVNEWCWDYYGPYNPDSAEDPVGAESGTRHVYRGGGWNDFGKNMRSAYRAAGQSGYKSYNLGVRLVRNAGSALTESILARESTGVEDTSGEVLIVFFSWSGNTRGIAQEIRRQTGADSFEITLVHPYSTNYNTVLMEAQEDQHRQARPEIAEHIDNFDDYDVILLGYPNWWASIPMPIASFLEEYDFTGKMIIPFCSHGGGRFGQSLTAIAKLAPESVIGTGLSIHYSGGSTLASDISAWLDENGIERK
ncbi:MAG: SUMF1/EgtB/PvdO family nonheme iron enzyme [Flexilinea sp.]|nr:SUMF1/EgtB/PvdO family nonheme iron enzyme [Flexilinea sp.]